MPNVPEWYNVMDMRIYGTEARHDVTVITVLGRNDFLLRKIIMEGGGKLLCHLWNEDVKTIRKHIINAFEHLLKNDLMFCAENDVEFHIWKVAFYQLVEALKFTLKDESLSPTERDVVQRNMVTLLNEGLDIYERMLDTLDRTYSLGLETYYEVLEPRPADKRAQIALVSAQKCLLCLGDLARYKEQIQGTSNYGQARQYYQKASNVEPRNGRPFNQLAILAFQTKRKFEAVYYNMRCLQSKNPFPSSQESLTLIFEDMKKKWELAEKKRLEERDLRDREKDGFRLVRGTRLRR
jgi:protein SMG6